MDARKRGWLHRWILQRIRVKRIEGSIRTPGYHRHGMQTNKKNIPLERRKVGLRSSIAPGYRPPLRQKRTEMGMALPGLAKGGAQFIK